MLERGLDFEAMQDESIIPELDISCRNLEPTDNHIQNDESSESPDELSYGSFESIGFIQQTTHSAPHLNPPMQAGSLLTLDSFASKSTDTIISPQQNLHSLAEADSSAWKDEIIIAKSKNAHQILKFDEQMGVQLDISFSQKSDQSDPSPKEIQSIHMSIQPARQVKEVRQLALPNWGIVKSVVTELFQTTDSSTLQPLTTCSMLKKKIDATEDANIVLELDKSCKNLKCDEKMVKDMTSNLILFDTCLENTSQAVSPSIQLDISSDNHIQGEISFKKIKHQLSPLVSTARLAVETPPQATCWPEQKETDTTKGEDINSQSTDPPRISNSIVEQRSRC